MKTKKASSSFFFFFFILPFSFFPTTHRPHPFPIIHGQSHKTPSISCILASHHLPYVHSPNPSPSPAHTMPPGNVFTVECRPSPLHETRYKIRGGKKTPRSHPSRWCHLMGGWWRRHLRWHFFYFFYDRQDWRRLLLSSLYTVYILGRYLGIYVCMYLGGTVLCEVFALPCLRRYSIYGCCYTLIHYFFFESRKGTLLLR